MLYFISLKRSKDTEDCWLEQIQTQVARNENKNRKWNNGNSIAQVKLSFCRNCWNKTLSYLYLLLITNQITMMTEFLLNRYTIASNIWLNQYLTLTPILIWREIITLLTLFYPRSCKRSDTLFQKSLLLFSIWREYFYSQPTHFSSQPKK